MRRRRSTIRLTLGIGLLAFAAPAGLRAQGVSIHDLVINDQSVPVRLVGYGLVTGLSGTGDQTSTGRSSGHTVQTVANLLRRFDISVPAEILRTRNVAAVLVTAEVSPYLRAGGRFEVQVASVGDARSIRGGVLWMTPLIAEAGGAPMATAQGAILIDDAAAGDRRRYTIVEGSGRVAAGGVLEGDLPRPSVSAAPRLLLRDPDIATAARIAAVVDSVVGKGTAKVEDPGSIALTLKEAEAPAQLATIQGLRVEPLRTGRIVIDRRQGTVVAGGELPLGPGVVSVGGITLAIGRVTADSTRQDDRGGALRIPAGATVQDLAAALHAVRTPAAQVAQIFEALRAAGVLSAEIIAR